MSSNDVVDRIQSFNQGRDPERLLLKYLAMRANAFAFLRGTCHLFHQDWSGNFLLDDAPSAWITGDLHLENFASYKGDNHLTYFDINDFDQGVLAPCTRDLARFLTSAVIAAQTLGIGEQEAYGLCRHFIDAYAAALRSGKALWIERSMATEMVRDSLAGLKDSFRVTYYASRIRVKKGMRLLRLDGKRTLEVTAAQRNRVIRAMHEFADTQPNPEFFRVLDVARRVAGMGSLGSERYIILVEGKGSPVGNYLLDLKIAQAPILQSLIRQPQPDWRHDAERMVSIQRRAQVVSPSFLFTLTLQGHSYVLRELLPSQDRLRIELWNGKLRRLEAAMLATGQVTAWSHLRSGGRQGSAIADEWIEFGSRNDWQMTLLDYAITYCRQVLQDWQAFCAAYDDGQLVLEPLPKPEDEDR